MPSSQIHSRMRDQVTLTPCRILLYPSGYEQSTNYALKLKLPGSAVNPANDVQLFGPAMLGSGFCPKMKLVACGLCGARARIPSRYIISCCCCSVAETGAGCVEQIDIERHCSCHSLNLVLRFIPLSAAAIDILNRLPRCQDRCPWVVPNPKTLKPYCRLLCTEYRQKSVAGIPEVRCHDLRHGSQSHGAVNVPIYLSSPRFSSHTVKTADGTRILGMVVTGSNETISRYGWQLARLTKASAA